MLSVQEARSRIIAPLRPTTAEVVALPAAWGRVTAAPVLARTTMPPADMSAMDGYALRACDGHAGRVLRVIGEAPAGHPFAGVVGAGEAVRLFTGSLLPAGADSVVVQEDVQVGPGGITLGADALAGRHVRACGQEFRVGEKLIAAGTRLGPRMVGLAAAGNHPWLVVHRRPRVAILATGDEISLPGEPLGHGSIVSSNAHALAALVRAAGGDPLVLPIARDTRAAIADAVANLAGVDMLVTTGGASVGDYDLVQQGLGPGFALDFWRIAMRPGKPLLSGTLGAVPVLGLPGNPVSALVCGLLFLWPALARLAGLPGTPPPTAPLPLLAPLPANDHREDYMRCTISPGPDGTDHARAFPRQDSSMMRLMAQADGLIVRPPGAPAALAGEDVPVLRLDYLGL